MFLLKHRWSALARNAWRNRQELISAGLTSRRDLLKLGLLTPAGYLVAKHGLSSRVANAGDMQSPRTRPFINPLPIPPVKRPLEKGALDLSPYPSIVPNNDAGEGRTRPHQAFIKYPQKFSWPPSKVFEIRTRECNVTCHSDLPTQKLWGYDGYCPMTMHAKYGEQILVRNHNDLPNSNGGFGAPQISTHLHNAHTPSESDGFPLDFFPDPHRSHIAQAKWYDHHYPNVLAGFSSTNPPNGDIRESLSTLWFHDHRVGFTAQNVYKGLASFYLLYNHLDSGDETKGFRLPGVRDPNDFYAPVQYDIPLMLIDRLFDGETGETFYDLFEKDGIIGDKFTVNGVVQPYFNVEPRRYRFRVLNSGPSRFYQIFLSDRGSNQEVPFWQISTDGNLMPRPLKVKSIALGVAERNDIVIDFSQWAGKTLYLENRWLQLDGRGPEANLGDPLGLKAAGSGDFLIQFRVGTTVTHPDQSVNFETNPNVTFYPLPPRYAPRINREFRLSRVLNMWTINDKLFPEDTLVDHVNFRVKMNSIEQWVLENKSGGWMHPMHIHFEEHQLVSRNGRAILPGNQEYGRKDVVKMQHGERNVLWFRFRDFDGRYPFHCHNVLHEDFAMMMRFDIDATGDFKTKP